MPDLLVTKEKIERKREATRNSPRLRFPDFSGPWQSKTFSELGHTYNGLTGKSAADFGSGSNYITYKQIFDHSYIDTSKFSAVRVLPGEKQNTAQKGDIFFTTSSETPDEVGYTSVLLEDIPDLYLNSFCFGFRPDTEQLVPNFARFLLRSQGARKEISKLAQGSTRYNLSKTELLKVSITLPSGAEQTKIADLLAAVDDTIEVITKKLELLTQYKKANIQQIFSQKIRFKDQNGAAYPAWRDVKLGTILKERKLFAPKDGRYEHISLTTGGVVPKSERYDRDFLVGKEDKDYKITRVDDICYNPANLKFGVIARNRYKEGIFSPIYVTYEVHGADVSFIEYLVTRRDFIQYARKYEEGTVYERMAVKPADLARLDIKLPCREEQQKIAAYITLIDEKLQTTKATLAAAKNFKKSLMQRMFV